MRTRNRVNVTLSVDPELKAEVEAAARATDRSLSNYLVHALRRSLAADALEGVEGVRLRMELDAFAAQRREALERSRANLGKATKRGTKS